MGMYDKYGARYAASLNAMIHQQALAEQEQAQQEQGGGAFGEIAQAAMGGAPEMAPEDVFTQAPGGEHGPMGTPGINPVEPIAPFESPNPADYGGGQGAFIPDAESSGPDSMMRMPGWQGQETPEGFMPEGSGSMDPGVPAMGPNVIDESGAMGGNPDATLGEGGGKGPKENLTMEQVWREGTSSDQNKIIEQFEDQGIDVEKEADKAAEQDPKAAEAYAPKGKKFSDLTKKEKGGFLLEFGLRMMQASGNVETSGFGEALGTAGLGTLGSIRGKLAADTAAMTSAEQTTYDREQDRIDQGEDADKISQKNAELEMQRRRDEIAGKGANYTGEPNRIMNGEEYHEVYTEDGGKEWVKSTTSEGGAFRPDDPKSPTQGPYASQVEMGKYVWAHTDDPNDTKEIKAQKKHTRQYLKAKLRTEHNQAITRINARKLWNDERKIDWDETVMEDYRAEFPGKTDSEIRDIMVDRWVAGSAGPSTFGGSASDTGRRGAFDNPD